MKNKLINISYLLLSVIMMLGLFSCEKNIPAKPSPSNNTTTEEPASKEVSQLAIARAEIEIVEGHSHAPKDSRTDINGVMWSSKFNTGYFHGNPYSEDIQFPMKRIQKIEFTPDSNGKLTPKHPEVDSIFNIFATNPRKTYKEGLMNALIVRLFDKDGNRIDQALKADSMANRVQVFYQVINVKPSFPEFSLPESYDLTDICYYWYYDRHQTSDDQNINTYGDFYTDEAVGFRGVIQSLEARTQFALRMSVTVLPKGQTKGSMTNSITMSDQQMKNIVFQMDIPFRVVTEYPNFYDDAVDVVQKETGKDFFDDDWGDNEDQRVDELKKQFEDRYYSNINQVYPSHSIEQLKEEKEIMLRLPGESSNFYL